MRRPTPSCSFLVVLTLTLLASPSYVLAQAPQLSGISPTSVTGDPSDVHRERAWSDAGCQCSRTLWKQQ